MTSKSAWIGFLLASSGMLFAAAAAQADEPGCLVVGAWAEARGEPAPVIEAVVSSIVNRAHARGQSVCDTVMDPAALTGVTQTMHDLFSAAGQPSGDAPDQPRSPRDRAQLMTVIAAASKAVAGTLPDRSQGATHFYSPAGMRELGLDSAPAWAANMVETAKVGPFIFLREKNPSPAQGPKLAANVTLQEGEPRVDHIPADQHPIRIAKTPDRVDPPTEKAETPVAPSIAAIALPPLQAPSRQDLIAAGPAGAHLQTLQKLPPLQEVETPPAPSIVAIALPPLQAPSRRDLVAVGPVGAHLKSLQKLPPAPSLPREQASLASKPRPTPPLQPLKLASLPTVRFQSPSPPKLTGIYTVPVVIDPPSYLGAPRPRFSVVAQASAAELPHDSRVAAPSSWKSLPSSNAKAEANPPGAGSAWDDAAALPPEETDDRRADAAQAEREPAPTELLPRNYDSRPTTQGSAASSAGMRAPTWNVWTPPPAGVAPSSVPPPDYRPPDYRSPDYYAQDYRTPAYRPAPPTWAPSVPVAGSWTASARTIAVCSGPGRAVLFSEWGGRWVRGQAVRDNRCNV